MTLKQVNGTPLVPDQKQSADAQNKSDGTSKTYTQAEIDQLLQAQDSRVGRELKTAKETIDTMANQMKVNAENQKTAQAAADALEVERVKGDPAQMAAYRTKKAASDQADVLAAREADLTKKEADLVTKQADIDKVERANIMARYEGLGVNPTLMQGLATLSNEQFETVCKTMTAGKVPIVPLKKVDSGNTVGGTDFKGLSAEDKIASGLAKMNTK